MSMHYQSIIAKNRATGFRHHSYELEQQLIADILQGNTDAALQHAQMAGNTAYKDVLAPQPLRAEKNMAISLVAVLSRALIEHGAEAEIIFFLSDYFLNEIEKVNTNIELQQVLYQIIVDYCDAAKDIPTQNHSSYIKRCIQIIQDRLYDRVRVEEIADALNLSPDYLSQLFKEEMGCGLYSYILDTKIAEAKHLLQHSQYSISEIGEMLGFCSGAYFSNVFKKLSGVSPLSYRLNKGEKDKL